MPSPQPTSRIDAGPDELDRVVDLAEEALEERTRHRVAGAVLVRCVPGGADEVGGVGVRSICGNERSGA